MVNNIVDGVLFIRVVLLFRGENVLDSSILFAGVYQTSIDAEEGKVMVSGLVDPDTIIKKLNKGGKPAVLWGSKPGGVANQFQKLHLDGNGGGGKGQQPKDAGGKGHPKDAGGKAQKGGGKDAKMAMPQPTPQQIQQMQQQMQMKGAPTPQQLQQLQQQMQMKGAPTPQQLQQLQQQMQMKGAPTPQQLQQLQQQMQMKGAPTPQQLQQLQQQMQMKGAPTPQQLQQMQQQMQMKGLKLPPQFMGAAAAKMPFPAGAPAKDPKSVKFNLP
uniref:HMA domain-containing protein n=2 Tax=Aegilops tauschii subsp. strangulata TaxID=200361 RepID=A0A453HRT1_AEGTS